MQSIKAATRKKRPDRLLKLRSACGLPPFRQPQHGDEDTSKFADFCLDIGERLSLPCVKDLEDIGESVGTGLWKKFHRPEARSLRGGHPPGGVSQ